MAAKIGAKKKGAAPPPLKGETESKTTVAKKSGGMFMTGAQAQQELEKVEQAQVERQEQVEKGLLYTFSVEKGGETTATFLDGSLDEDGMLDSPSMYRHEFYEGGKFWSHVCLHTNPDWGPCPICEDGERSVFVTAFTVIDHTAYKSKRNPGTVIKDTKKLLIAKPQTLKLLRKLAQKYGGLAGCTFEISRTGDKSPRVGDSYIMDEQKTLEELASIYGEDKIQPANYEEQFEVESRKDLMAMGYGSGTSIGGESDDDGTDIGQHL